MLSDKISELIKSKNKEKSCLKKLMKLKINFYGHGMKLMLN